MHSIKVPELALTLIPADLAGSSNGALKPNLLRSIRGGRLHPRAADAWEAMVNAAAMDGVQLEPTHDVHTYRHIDVQTRIFLRHYTNDEKGTSGLPVSWRGKHWYLKRGQAPAAVPETSSHGWGLAVDIRDVSVTHRSAWLAERAKEFGWLQEYEVEPWHFRYSAGDNMLAAAQAFLDKQKLPATVLP
jgi:LAS superfamily LD-carboxypeptidase LdcB